ncbi:MAG: MFS transporter, partial [Humibacter sp.]
MTDESTSPVQDPTASSTRTAHSFEPWMLSNIVSGAVMSGFLVLLIPPFITHVTGSAARAGVVFAVIALSAMTGPVFGRIADRYSAHRIVYTLSFVGMGLAFGLLALDGSNDVYSPIAGVLLGTSLSAKGSVGSGFLVGSGLPGPVQAKQLTVFNLLMFGGQIVGGLLVALLSAIDLGYSGEFGIAAALIAVGAVYTWFTTGTPERRVRAVADDGRRRRTAVVAAAPNTEPAADAQIPDTTARPSLRQTLGSPFGALMLVIALGGVCMAMLSSQIANILPAVFGISPAVTGILIAVAGALGIP